MSREPQTEEEKARKAAEQAAIEAITTRIGAMCKERRESLGISQEHLAKTMGCARATLSYLESGSTSIRFSTWLQTFGSLGILHDFATHIEQFIETAGSKDCYNDPE